VYLASDAGAGLTGKLVSAPHDDWQEWDESAVAELDGTAWLTLRRLDRHTVSALPTTVQEVPS
jgi:hypothetical protein